ncbi:T6SS immunity protein Tdi1 domain-containing protein [Ruminococcus sp.]|uniref:T6SS immunity protein Tdi1 domain-containing protein n=1 Tax=Ruminococcus sp. TaxID=41978 RepID=UPI0025E60822|nr:T6SS immunity protein Tdi1 domain-containing protein [Ruminococcus sp.]
MMDLEFGELDEEYLSIEKYNAAVKKYGKLEYDECFGYVPLLGLGGKESVNNLKKVKIKEHIALITEMVGEI